MSSRIELDATMDQIIEMWEHQDTLFQIIGETNQWNKKHGSDWIFADLPYHLTYCNHDLVSRPMKLGRDLPDDERDSFGSSDDINKWNERKFADRPSGQTVDLSLKQLRASREEIREVVAGWSDADLERPIWMPFMGGSWVPARSGLYFTLNHDWSEFMQLRIHMGLSEPVPSPDITTTFVGGALGRIYPGMLNKEAAGTRTFITLMTFRDPGVGDFIIEVRDGEAAVRQGTVQNPDLVLTQSAETFQKILAGIQPFPEAIQVGTVQVSDMEKLAIFGELFPM